MAEPGGPPGGTPAEPPAGAPTGPVAGGLAGPVAGGLAGSLAGGVAGSVAGGLAGSVAGPAVAGSGGRAVGGAEPGVDGRWVRERLADALLYLCTGARREQGDLAEFLDAALRGGVDIVQLREKGLEARDELDLLEVVADAARRHGALWSVNDRADLAAASGADVLHLGQDDLPVPHARRLLGPAPLVGRSTHDQDQVDAADAEPGVDYFCVGPTWPTPTKPGRPAPGLDLTRHAAARATRPWFAIGGIDAGRLDDVLAAGARRVVVVRAITEAPDPEAAARSLRARLAADVP